MTSSAPASIPEQIGALNARINALEQEVQALRSAAVASPVALNFEDFRLQLEARVSNAINEMEARHQREVAALAILRAGGQP